MKKFTSILLSFVFIISCFQVVFADTNGSMTNFKETRSYVDGQFTDVSTNDWFAENVKKAYELGLVNGASETTFNPNADITIAETITLASRLNNTYKGSTHTFGSDDIWYQPYVDYAIQNGIIKNDEYTDYSAKATRAQFAKIFASSLPDDALKAINTIEDRAIPDVSTSENYATAVYKLYRAGILTGNDDKGTFTPNTNIQRSAVAAIVSRMAIESMRVEKILKVEKLQLFSLGSFTSKRSIEFARYNNNLYSFAGFGGIGGSMNVVWSLEDYEPYIDNDYSNFSVLFMPAEIGESNNKFVSGEIDFANPRYVLSSSPYRDYFEYSWDIENIGLKDTIGIFSLKYNGKTFNSITGEEYLELGLKDGDTGRWNGVRFYISQGYTNVFVYYNMNDLTEYFGVDRSFKIDDSGEERIIVIEE